MATENEYREELELEHMDDFIQKNGLVAWENGEVDSDGERPW